MVGDAEGGGGADALFARGGTTPDQGDDGEQIGRHLQEEDEVVVLEEGVRKPKYDRRTLQVERETPEDAKQIASQSSPPGVPMREDDQGNGDPALPADGQVAVPTRGDGNTDGSARQTSKATANKGIQVASSVDVDAQSVSRGRIFAHGTQMQAGFGAIDIVPGQRHEQVTKIDEDVLVGKHDRAKVRNLGKQGNGHAGNDRAGDAG